MRRVYLEIYGRSIDTLVASGDACRLHLDLALHILKVVPSPPRNMMKLGPFLLRSYASRSMRNGGFAANARIVEGDVDELKDEWTAGDDAATAG